MVEVKKGGNKTLGVVLIFISIWLIGFFLGVQYYPAVPPYTISYITQKGMCPAIFSFIQIQSTNIQSGFTRFLGSDSMVDFCTKLGMIMFFSYISLVIGVISIVSGLYLTLK